MKIKKVKSGDIMIDQYTKIWVVRLFKEEKNGIEETMSVKKSVYLSEIISYEEGHSDIFDWEGPVMYVMCNTEAFYCAGDVKDFDKEMDRWIKGMREYIDNMSE
jgi:hypothetical protein